MAVREEPETADAHEAPWQDMQKEPANELLCGNRHLPLPVTVSVVPPSEGNALSVERLQTMV